MAAILLDGELETTLRAAPWTLSPGRDPALGRQAIVDDVEGADRLGQL